MSFLMRIFFLACLGLLVGTGVVAGINLIAQEQQGASSSVASDDTDEAALVDEGQEREMIVEDSFFATSSNERPEDASSSSGNVSTIRTKSDGITASAYLVGDVETGNVYLSYRPNAVLPVASISKLVTAIIATNTLSPTTTISLASTTFMAELPVDISGVHGGESFEFKDALSALLLSSSNRAAEAIASTTDRDQFLSLMYSTAWEIGMPKTFFADPSGLDPQNAASASDLFSLARYLYQHRPDILTITRTAPVAIASSSEHDAHIVDSTHPFIRDPRFIGGKTGRTPQAGETMLTLLRINGRPLAFIVMHSDFGARQADTEILIKKAISKI